MHAKLTSNDLFSEVSQPHCHLVLHHSSSKWKEVPANERKHLLEENMGDDGEFWMSFDDMKKHFTDFEICNVTIDQLYEDEKCESIIGKLL